MDMGFHLVSTLSYYLYPEGFGCTGKSEGRDRCPSNDHSNGDRDYTPHTQKQIGWATCDACCDPGTTSILTGCAAHSHWHKSGDYALRHSWM